MGKPGMGQHFDDQLGKGDRAGGLAGVAAADI
jgi:hypothetical protein